MELYGRYKTLGEDPFKSLPLFWKSSENINNIYSQLIIGNVYYCPMCNHTLITDCLTDQPFILVQYQKDKTYKQYFYKKLCIPCKSAWYDIHMICCKKCKGFVLGVHEHAVRCFEGETDTSSTFIDDLPRCICRNIETDISWYQRNDYEILSIITYANSRLYYIPNVYWQKYVNIKIINEHNISLVEASTKKTHWWNKIFFCLRCKNKLKDC